MLDLAEVIRERYGRVVLERPAGTSPANALRPLVAEDIDRYQHEDPRLARGEFPAQCLQSGVLRRYALEMREQQADTISAAIVTTSPDLALIVARAHAAALVSDVQTITDQIGERVLRGDFSRAGSLDLTAAADLALDDLDHTFHAIIDRRQAST